MSPEILDSESYVVDTESIGETKYIKTIDQAKDFFIHLYKNTNASELSMLLKSALENDGYKLKEGSPKDGVYTRGNRIMRILFGAFSKFDRCTVVVIDKDEGTVANFSKGSSGVSGGLIGMNQVKKEFARLNAKMKKI